MINNINFENINRSNNKVSIDAIRYTGSRFLFFLVLLLTFNIIACKKIVDVPPPVNTITSTDVFENEATATSAVMGIYSNLIASSGISFGTGTITRYAGLSADELKYFYSDDISQFESNSLQSNNGMLSNELWSPAYSAIYRANAVIEGLNASGAISDSVKKQLTGEAKFLRSFCYFYLTNLFGDVPLVSSTAWKTTATLNRSPKADIYKFIISDLLDAQHSLATNYSLSKNERTRVNKWAATALLARVYLFKKDWLNAEMQSSALIENTNDFSLQTDLNQVFLKNSKESIWQAMVYNQWPYAPSEANDFIPYSSSDNPMFYITDQLLNAFEVGDERRSKWIDSTMYDDGNAITTYYYPFKYKIKEGAKDNIEEYYSVLRLAEQYLIRAEARSHQNNQAGAISDLNVIRNRAGLADLSTSLSQAQVLAAIAQERRIELFSEWGHRWFDLERTDAANTILSLVKGNEWQETDQLYPIPFSELQKAPALTQNPGYQ